jgi:beta-lactamase regulating signal transducer with metallopeptidase domain
MIPSSVEMVVKSSAIVAVAAVATALMRRRASAASRHLVWTLAVVALLALPAAVVVIPSWNIPIRRMPSVSFAPPAQIAIESHSNPTVDTAVSGDLKPHNAAASLPSSIAVLPIVYVAGIVFLLGRLSVEHWHSKRILSRSTPLTDVEWTTLLDECAAQLGVRRPVRLLQSREEVMPMTSGVRRPGIVIPSVADLWDMDRRRAVILHELAHVARLDCLTQTLAAVAAALYWPHPGVWWTARQLRVEREHACDDCVLSSGTEPREYASHLLEIAHSLGRYRAPALAVGMARPRQLEGRMMAMLDPTRNRAVPAASRRMLALVSAVVIVTPLAAATLDPVSATADVRSVQAPRVATAANGVAMAVAQSRGPETTTLAGGTWQIRLAGDGRSAHLTISVAPGSSYGTTIALDRVEGLAAILTGPGGPARYTLKRDAGTFEFEGVIRAGAGGGTFSFTPSTTFGDELVRRGFSRPTPLEQGTLAWSDIGFAFLDELNALKYDRPTVAQLVNGARHGVSRTYLREMSDLGYRVGTIEALVRLRDHGVDATYVRGMQAEGFSNQSVEDLVRLRDHGIDPSFVQGMRGLGYALNLDQLVNARNHGVDAGFADGMRAAGLGRLSLDDLVNARNHGVDPGYVRELRELGYQLTLPELINARNHGVDPGFVREMAAAGYQHPSMTDLIRLREHGVNASTVERLKSRGFDRLSIDRLIELQSRGASADSATVGPRLYSTGSVMAGLHAALRDINATVQRWADRWLR